MLDKNIRIGVIALFTLFSFCSYSQADRLSREEQRKQELNELQNRFEWWPTDAKPSPVKDPERGGYWWWPTEPGKARPLGETEVMCMYIR